MKLILTAAVDNLGVAGDVVEVKPGYGRNYLLPRGYAVQATRGAEKHIESLRRARQSKLVHDLDHARELKAQLEALEGVTVSVKTSDKGKLFGSVMANDVVAAVEAAEGPELDASMVQLAKGQVKTTGEHTVTVDLAGDITAQLTFQVVSA